MLKGNQKNVEPVAAPMPGAKGAYIQWLVAKPEGAKDFYMRRIIVEEGGVIPVHTHPEVHEMYILTGEGEIRTEDRTEPIGPGDFTYVESNEPHSIVNLGSGSLTLICCINVIKN